MNSKKRLGSNIRGLREFFGETQEDLAGLLQCTSKNVSSYETGRTEPNMTTLNVIATHYSVTTDDLLYGDWAYVGEVSSFKNAIKQHDTYLFPLVSSEKALKNDDFRRALAAQKELYEHMQKYSLDYPDNLIDKCLDGYEKAMDNENSVMEAKANLVPLCFFLLRGMLLPSDFYEQPPAGIKILIQENRRFKTLFEDYSEMPDEELDTEDKKIIMEIDREAMSYIAELKKSRGFSELADYYLAMRYFFGAVDNKLGLEFNLKIGIEMIDSFRAVGNPYAIRFWKIFDCDVL